MLSRLAALSLATANCSEHGTEIFSQENNQTLCLCNDLYTGGGDFFDTRIESTQFSLTCTASRVGEIVVWTIVVISSVYRMIELLRVFWERYRYLNETTGHSLMWVFRHDKGTQLISADIVNSIFLLVVSILKINGYVLGTDSSVTIIFILLVTSLQLTQISLGLLEFRTLLSPCPVEVARQLYRSKARLDILAFSTYTIGVLVPTCWSLSIKKNVGPIDDYEFLVILIRNLSGVFWSLETGLGVLMIQRQAKQFIHSSTMMNDPEVAKILVILRRETCRASGAFFTTTLLMAIFTIPWLWSQQTYAVAFTMFIFSIGHVGRNFPVEHLKNKGENTINKHQIVNSASAVERKINIIQASQSDV